MIVFAVCRLETKTTMGIKRTIKRVAQAFGYDIVPFQPGVSSGLPPDLGPKDKRTIEQVRPFTMTSVDRIAAVIAATRYIEANRVPGAIVECGVWRGGSTMAILHTLDSKDREVYLYDTFEGMSEPTKQDVSFDGVSAEQQLSDCKRGTGVWCEASIEDVRQNVSSTGYPAARTHLIRGKVEETIPETLPGGIALLRLDTDWYESTRHELKHLFPLLHPRGVLIVDDYGHWAGAKQAVDEYFAVQRGHYYFHRIDYTGRLIMRVCSE